MVLLALHLPASTIVPVICLRQSSSGESIAQSIVIEMLVPAINASAEMPEYINGWERNPKQELKPRAVNMAQSMDPKRLAETAVDLNLKLMKWRLLPGIDLAKLSTTRCLLLGAGTLGCNVARCLLGWGVRQITFVDSGKVSFSNPVTLWFFCVFYFFSFSHLRESTNHHVKSSMTPITGATVAVHIRGLLEWRP